jgi:hypothetical protein
MFVSCYNPVERMTQYTIPFSELDGAKVGDVGGKNAFAGTRRFPGICAGLVEQKIDSVSFIADALLNGINNVLQAEERLRRRRRKKKSLS